MTDGNKISLLGTDVVIPYRGASTERKQNLRAVLRYLDRTYVEYAAWVMEADELPSFDWHEMSDKKVRAFFLQDSGPFPKSRLCNLGARLSSSRVICFHDADSIANPGLMLACLHDLRAGPGRDAWGAFGQVLNVNGAIREDFIATGDYALLEPYSLNDGEIGPDMDMLYLNNPGGVVFIRREKFFEIGGFNTAFIGWGCEDEDIVYRGQRHGLQWFNAPDRRLFHLHHDAAGRSGLSGQPATMANVRRSSLPREMDDAAFQDHLAELRAQLA